MRGQTTLPTLAVALLVLTTTLGLGLAMAESAFGNADRDPQERQVAVALSERLVTPSGSVTTRANVVTETALEALTATQFRARYPVVGDRSVRVRLNDRTLVESGSPGGGTTIRRIVLTRTRQNRSYEPRFRANNATTLPRRTNRIRLTIRPPSQTVVRTVRANGRVVLHNTAGLSGTVIVSVPRFETTQLRFTANRSLSRGDVRVTYFPEQTAKAVLAVTVDD